MKGSEVKGIVILVLFLFSTFSLLGYVFSVGNTTDIDSITKSTSEYIVDSTISEIIGIIILVVVGFIISILVFFGILKKG